jgi:hypothetical protein
MNKLIICIKICFFDLQDVTLMINIITEDWLKPKNLRERNMMITWAQRSRTIVISSYILMGVLYICCIFLPIFGISVIQAVNTNSTERLFPLRVYYFYDVTKWPQYVFTYINLSIAIFFAATVYTSIDNFLGLLVFHICGQLDILSTRFVYLNKLVKFHDELKNCVMFHTRLLRYIPQYSI